MDALGRSTRFIYDPLNRQEQTALLLGNAHAPPAVHAHRQLPRRRRCQHRYGIARTRSDHNSHSYDNYENSPPVAPRVTLTENHRPRRAFLTALQDARDARSCRTGEKSRTALTALRPHCHRKLTRIYDPNSAQTRHFLRRHCGT